MAAQTFQTLSTISFVIAGVCLVLAIVLWFVFKIPSVIGDLSGRTAKKSIAQMRATNEKTGSKSYRESRANIERGKLTGTLPNLGQEKSKPSAKPTNKTFNQKKNKPVVSDTPETGLLAENKVVSYNSQETGMIGSEPTGLLVDENTNEPLVSSEYMQISATPSSKKITMIDEVIFIHTNEVIEC